jgi:homoserine kinase
MKSATAFAPATVANVAVGFDILGFALESVGDIVTVNLSDRPSIFIADVINETGSDGVLDISREPAENTATVGLIQLREDLQLNFGFDVVLRKGIALGSGMGGSAASAVAALLAANSLLDSPLSKEALFKYALTGEQAASGAVHPDNVAPSLFGGMILTLAIEPLRYVSLPWPPELLTVIVHPHIRVDTRRARTILRPEVLLKDHVIQSAHLGGFIAGCFRNDTELIRQSFHDRVIEPQRAQLIPGFAEVKAAAIEQGALGAAVSGSGPSVFAWVTSPAAATQVRDAMLQAFRQHGSIAADSWISPINQQGAFVIR